MCSTPELTAESPPWCVVERKWSGGTRMGVGGGWVLYVYWPRGGGGWFRGLEVTLKWLVEEWMSG